MPASFIFRKTLPEELPTVMALLASGREIMHASGNPLQWPEGTPSEEKVRQDIAGGNSCLVLEGETPVATFAFIPGPDPTYSYIEGGAWISDGPYYVIHRIAKSREASGIFRAVLDWCFSQVAGNGFLPAAGIRIDTHRDNAIMRHCIESYGFSYCGIIYLENGEERLAFEKIVSF